MANKIYALLVGINEYHPQSTRVSTLYGCVNDIEAIQEYLNHAIATRNKIAAENGADNKWKLVDDSVVPWKLTNELATRQAIIDGFEKHLCQADSDDVVLFYYAGHGSDEPAPKAFEALELNDRIETLVCHDSRTPGGQDLADKELNYLIEKVAKKDPHILIILDSCHSGTATRDPDVVERRTGSNAQQPRDLNDFIFPQEWVEYRLSESYKRPRHVAISACRDFETAKEYTKSYDRPRGAFSYFLTEALKRTNGGLSYANLVQDINALITGKVKEQSPQIEAPAEELRQTFLGGAAGERINYFPLTYNKKEHRSWIINGGLLHGIRPTSEGKTSLAIFPQGTELEDLQDIDKAICKAEVTRVMTEASKVELLDEKIELSQEQAYWGVVTHVPLPNLKVFFKGDEAGKNIVLNVFEQGENKFVTKADSQDDADYYLEADKGRYWILQPSDRKPLVAPVPEIPDTQGYTQQRAKQIIKRLEHVARWKNILELKTSPTSQIQAGDVEMEVIVTSGDEKYSSKYGRISPQEKENASKTEISALRGEYTWKDNKSEPPRVEVKVTNKSEKNLYFQIVELAGSFAIEVPRFFEERSSIRLPDKFIKSESVDGKRLKVGINKKYLENGITQYDTIFKLIVSDREFDASSLEQPGLDNPPPVKRSSGLSGTLNRLMNKVYTRETYVEEEEHIDNWMTQEVKVTLIKPPGGVEIKQSESTSLLTGVELQEHPSFKGKFSLNPLPPSSWNVNSDLIPPIVLEKTLEKRTSALRDGKRSPEPYNFNLTRSPGSFNVLEIVDVQDRESVTPENPIKLSVGEPLASNEYILPIAKNGESFLLLGQAKTVKGKTEITIERLPEPRVDSRNPQGSIKIVFFKLFSEADLDALVKALSDKS